MPRLGDSGLVLGVDRKRLELRHAGSDEDEVQRDDGHEDPVADDLAVAAALAALRPGRPRRRRHAEQEGRVDEERRGVAQEEDL